MPTETTICPTCKDERRILNFYSRGQNSPPGNQYVGCPDCAPGRAYEASIQAELRPTDWWQVAIGSDRVLHLTSGDLTTPQSVDDLIEAIRAFAPLLPVSESV